MSATFRKGVGIGVGAGLVVVVALALVLALVPAGAQEGDTSGDTGQSESTEPDGSEGKAEGLSDEDRACLEENGAQLPELDENGRPVQPERPEPDSEDFDAMREEFEARHQAFRDAAEACGLDIPEQLGHEPLSDEDRACLEENGAQLPELDENGDPVRPDPSDRPEPGTEEFDQMRAEREAQHEAFRAAAEACGLELGGGCGPGGPGHFGGRGRFGGGPGTGAADEGAPAEGTSIGNAFLVA